MKSSRNSISGAARAWAQEPDPSHKLTQLGDPAPNAPKWFAAVEIIRLAYDKDWLHKATKEIAKYWRQKRQRYQCSAPAQPIL